MVGSTAVLVGLLLARAGWLEGDAVAALLVALLVLVAAGRLMNRNIDVLMDRVPAEAEEAARAAIASSSRASSSAACGCARRPGSTSRTS